MLYSTHMTEMMHMAHGHETIDISDNPDLLRLVETMRRRNTSAVLTNGAEDVAVVTPVGESIPKKRAKRAKTQADHDAFIQAAGSWTGLIDAEEFKAYIRERRTTANRPSVKL